MPQIPWNAIGGAVGPMLGAAVQGGFSAMSANKARAFAKRMAIRGPSWQVEGLKRAGLNPVLAAGGGFGGLSGSVPQASGISAPDVVSSAKAGAKADAELKILRSEAKIKKNEEQQSLHKVWTEIGNSAVRSEDALVRRLDRKMMEWRLPAAKAQHDIDTSVFGASMRKMNRILKSIRGLDTTTAK